MKPEALAAYKETLLACSWRAEKAEIQERDLIILRVVEFQRKMDCLSCQICYMKVRARSSKDWQVWDPEIWDEDLWINELKIFLINALKIL